MTDLGVDCDVCCVMTDLGVDCEVCCVMTDLCIDCKVCCVMTDLGVDCDVCCSGAGSSDASSNPSSGLSLLSTTVLFSRSRALASSCE